MGTNVNFTSNINYPTLNSSKQVTSNVNSTESSKDCKQSSSSFTKALNSVLKNNALMSSKEILNDSETNNDTTLNDNLTNGCLDNNAFSALMSLMSLGSSVQNSDYLNLLNNYDSSNNSSTSDSLISTLSGIQGLNVQSALNNYSDTSNNSMLQMIATGLGYGTTTSTTLNKSLLTSQTDDTTVSTTNTFGGRVLPDTVMQEIEQTLSRKQSLKQTVEQIIGSLQHKGIKDELLYPNDISKITSENVIMTDNLSIAEDNVGMLDIMQKNTKLVNENFNIVSTDGELKGVDESIKLKYVDEINQSLLSNNDSEESINQNLLDKNSNKTSSINGEFVNANGVKFTETKQIIKVSDESSQLKNSMITQIKDQILIAKNEGKQTVTMQLNPESLGKLDIKMVFEKGNLSVEIMTSNERTHSLLLSNISELKSVLQNNLADKPNVDVAMQHNAQSENLFEDNQNSNSRHQYQENKNYSNEQTNDDNNDDNDFMSELSRLRNLTYNII